MAIIKFENMFVGMFENTAFRIYVRKSWENTAFRIYVRKSQEKKFLKKPRNNNFGLKSEFSQLLGKNVTGNKVLFFGFLGLFFY